MKPNKRTLSTALALLTAFVLWTVAVSLIDVQAIGPNNSAVGLASINRFFHAFTGVHMTLYTLTDLLSLIPFVIVLGFTVLGLLQWFKRKSLLKVDRSLLYLGGFYIAVIAFFLFFELFTVNYRPVLIEGVLEGSYPSSTTMLMLCVMPTAAMQLNSRIQSRKLNRFTTIAIYAFTVLMVAFRCISGVHWLSDIIGGILLSMGLVMLYASFAHHNT